jgi:Fe-Mn family superoxide dismutase
MFASAPTVRTIANRLLVLKPGPFCPVQPEVTPMLTKVLPATSEASSRPDAVPAQHLLPPLPYENAALEPFVDTQTMMLHHDKHHASYVDKLNQALLAFPALQGHTANWLLLNLPKVPKQIRTAVRNNAGGHVNHSLFWRAMSAAGGGAPSGPLAEAITRDFGSFEQFKSSFEEAGATLFGSGWVWLVCSPPLGHRLQVLCTSGHDNPLAQGYFPILLNDCWEHAYYLKHENRRADYLKGWWSVANWHEAARRYEGCRRTSRDDWEAEGKPRKA